MERVLVLSSTHKVLTPCHPARALALLRDKQATVVRREPFTIILKGRICQPKGYRVPVVFMARWRKFIRKNGILPMSGIALGNTGLGRLFLTYLARALDTGDGDSLRGQMEDLLGRAGVSLADIDVAVLKPKFGRHPRLARLLTQIQLSDRLARLEAFQAAHGHALAICPLGDDKLLSAFILYTLQYPDVLAYDRRLAMRFPTLWAPLLPQHGLRRFAVLCRKVYDCMERHGRATESTGFSLSEVVGVTRLRNAARAGTLPEARVAALRWARFQFEPVDRVTPQKNIDATWRKRARRVLAGAKKQGHFRFPPGSSDKIWCSSQRIRFRAGKMLAWQELMLGQAGFPFESSRGCPFGPDWFRERLARLKDDMKGQGVVSLPYGSASYGFLAYMRLLDRQNKLCPERRAALVAIGAPLTIFSARRSRCVERLLSLRSPGDFLVDRAAMKAIFNLRRRRSRYVVQARAKLIAAGFPKLLFAADCSPVFWFQIEAMLEAGRASGFDLSATHPHYRTLRVCRRRHTRGTLSKTHRAQLRRGGFPMGMLRGKVGAQTGWLAANQTRVEAKTPHGHGGWL